MVPKASLKAVVDELETLTDQRHAYLNKRTGETVSISDEEIDIVENGEPLDDIPDWQREIVDIAREILHSDDYLELPSKYDIHDYAIIERFCQSQEDEGLRNSLLDLIRGSGAFGQMHRGEQSQCMNMKNSYNKQTHIKEQTSTEPSIGNVSSPNIALLGSYDSACAKLGTLDQRKCSFNWRWQQQWRILLCSSVRTSLVLL